MEYLKVKYPHERDQFIVFDEEPHIYTIRGDSNYTSVTTWNKSMFSTFDADTIIDKMMKSAKWNESKYFNMTKEDIKKLWSDSGKEASSLGTIMHENIEKFYNNVEVKDDSIEFKYFMKFYEDHKDELMGYRTEWMIYHEELRLAGSIDMVFIDKKDELHIFDWKRSKEIKKNAFGNKSSINKLIDHIPDSNYWHYCLQLNTYKSILEEKYDKKIGSLYLVCLHPNNKNDSYLKIKVADLQEEVKELFKERKYNLNIPQKLLV
jgi:hypothetical protein